MTSAFGVTVVILVIVLVGFAALWRRDVLALRDEAQDAYDAVQKNGPPHLAALSRQDFLSLYTFVHRVRRPKYILLFVAIAVAGTPAVLALSAGMKALGAFGPLVWQFISFFMLILWWVASLFLTLRIFYRRRPGTLDEEYENRHNRQRANSEVNPRTSAIE